jgi:hypothetical protein
MLPDELQHLRWVDSGLVEMGVESHSRPDRQIIDHYTVLAAREREVISILGFMLPEAGDSSFR